MVTARTPTKPLVALAAALALAPTVLACGDATAGPVTRENSTPSGGTVAASSVRAPAAANTKAERAAWEALVGPDGEYAALATYDAIIAKFGEVEPYVSIRQAEERHAAALERQLQRMGVAVPASNPYEGKITAPDSLLAAAKTGAKAEIANVDLYDDLIADAKGDSRLQRVFTNLQRASRDHHLPAHELAAEGDGTLTAAQMRTLAADHGGQGGQGGQGGNRGNGRGHGGGMRGGQGMGATA